MRRGWGEQRKREQKGYERLLVLAFPRSLFTPLFRTLTLPNGKLAYHTPIKLNNNNNYYNNNNYNYNKEKNIGKEKEKKRGKRGGKEEEERKRKERAFMDELYKRMKLKTVEEWVGKKREIVENGGRRMVYHRYRADLRALLTALYPHYPWSSVDWHTPQITAGERAYNFTSLTAQRTFLEHLYPLFPLSSLADWLAVPREWFKRHGGHSLLRRYSHDLPRLLQTLYPHYPWPSAHMPLHCARMNPRLFFQSMARQREFMDALFFAFGLPCLLHWLRVPREWICKHGGGSLIDGRYSRRLPALLRAVYPHYPWLSVDMPIEWAGEYPAVFFQSVDRQRRYIDHLFAVFRLTRLAEWLAVPRDWLIKQKCHSLLARYSFDHSLMFSSLYPNYPWANEQSAHGGEGVCFRIHRMKEKIKMMIGKYQIAQKKDWYRVPVELGVHKLLRAMYKSEGWSSSMFLRRGKKSDQRLLFAMVNALYPPHCVMENYRHPLFYLTMQKEDYEYDIFIPSLNIAMEYHGEQHYDDLPSGFVKVEFYQTRDKLKESLSSQLMISLISIPFWWDKSLSSLATTINSQIEK